MKEVFRTDTEVDWSEFQAVKVRVKRDPIRIIEEDDKDSYNFLFDNRLVDNVLPRKVALYYIIKKQI